MYGYNVVFGYSNIQIKKGDKYPDVYAVHDFDKELLKEHWRLGLEPKLKHHRIPKQLKGESNEG